MRTAQYLCSCLCSGTAAIIVLGIGPFHYSSGEKPDGGWFPLVLMAIANLILALDKPGKTTTG